MKPGGELEVVEQYMRERGLRWTNQRRLIAQAAFFLNRQLTQRAASQQRERYTEDMQLWEREVDRLRRLPGMRSRNISATIQLGVWANQWHVEENSTGRVLVLDG